MHYDCGFPRRLLARNCSATEIPPRSPRLNSRSLLPPSSTPGRERVLVTKFIKNGLVSVQKVEPTAVRQRNPLPLTVCPTDSPVWIDIPKTLCEAHSRHTTPPPADADFISELSKTKVCTIAPDAQSFARVQRLVEKALLEAQCSDLTFSVIRQTHPEATPENLAFLDPVAFEIFSSSKTLSSALFESDRSPPLTLNPLTEVPVDSPTPGTARWITKKNMIILINLLYNLDTVLKFQDGEPPRNPPCNPQRRSTGQRTGLTIATGHPTESRVSQRVTCAAASESHRRGEFDRAPLGDLVPVKTGVAEHNFRRVLQDLRERSSRRPSVP